MGRPAIRPGERGGVRPKQRGRTWFARVAWRDRDGKPHEYSVEAGSKGGCEDAADLRWSEIVALMDAAERPRELTLDAVAEQWFDRMERPRAKEKRYTHGAIAAYRSTWRSALSPMVGHIEVNTIERWECVEALRNLWRRKPGHEDPATGRWIPGEYLRDQEGALIPVTGLMPRSTLMRLLGFAADNGYRRDGINPLLGSQAPDRHEPEPRALIDDEADRLIARELARSTRHQRSNRDLHDAMVLLRYTGIRIGECLGLTWDRVLDLDGDNPRILIDRQLLERTMTLGPTKGKDRRSIALHPLAVCMLKYRREDSKWTESNHPVFATAQTGPGGRTGKVSWVRHSNLRRRWRESVEGTEWEWTHPHAMRATWVTKMERAFGLEDAAGMAGHSDGGATASRHYVDKGDVREVDPRGAFGGD